MVPSVRQVEQVRLRAGWTATFLWIAMIVALVLAARVLLLDQPVIDDWTYAWSVEHLLQTGELRVLDWSENYPFVQIVWGALFCLPFGFSFAALQLSTVVLAVIGALAFAALLHELTGSRISSVIGALVLVVNPVFFVLSWSFMTDVPLVSMSAITCWLLVRGLQREQRRTVALGCAVALAALGVRVVALALPVALLGFMLIVPRFRRRSWLVLPIGTLLLIGFGAIGFQLLVGTTSYSRAHVLVILRWLQVAPSSYLTDGHELLLHVGLALAPITLPQLRALRHQRRWWIVLLGLGMIEGLLAWWIGRIPVPLSDPAIWRVAALGDAQRLLQGAITPHPATQWITYGLIGVALPSAAVLVLRCGDLIRQERSQPRMFVLLYVLCQCGLIFGLWLFYDRYYLGLLPPLIALVLPVLQRPSRITLIGCGLLLIWSIGGTWDTVQLRRATAAGVGWLRAQHVPLAEIDAGYPLTGWHLYAHPENLPTGANRETDAPWVTTQAAQPYVIALSPDAGRRTLHTITWRGTPWSATTQLFVVEGHRSPPR